MIVLATDLSKHFEITGNLKAMAEANQQKDAQEDPELIMKLVMKVRSQLAVVTGTCFSCWNYHSSPLESTIVPLGLLATKNQRIGRESFILKKESYLPC